MTRALLLRAALILLGITVASGLLGFGVIPSALLFGARIAFFVAGTLFVAVLLAGLVKP
jgi:uncharacterized membrane protein YtjA (UPF0391 family)